MVKFLLTLMLTFLLMVNLSGQEKELDGIFAYVYNPDGLSKKSDNNTPNPSLQKVFDDLVRSKGVSTTLAPTLIITQSENMAAWAQPIKRIIGIEQKAYDICRSFGVDSLNALAGLLAHELIHYYENHDWQNHFIRNYAPLRDGEKLNRDSGKQMEMEADEMGGLLSQMAGYPSLEVMPAMLSKIYEEYGLDVSATNHYPNLADRMKMAEISKVNLTKLIPIFEIANYFMVTGAENEAKFYLEYILNNSKFQSRELHNNLGVLYAMSAFDDRPNQSLQYVFPFQLDLKSRLGTKGVSQDFERKSKIALKQFEKALILDDTYVTALMNMASIHILRGEFPDAEFRIYKAESQLGKTDPTILALKGNLAAYKGDLPNATKEWQEAVVQGSLIASKNLMIADQKTNSPSIKENYQVPYIDKIDLNKLYSMILRDEVAPDKSIELDDHTSFYSVVLDNSEIYIHMDYNSDDKFSFFHLVKQNGLDLPLNIGDTEQELLDKFGLPDVMLTSNDGTLCNYKSYNLIAVLQDGKIKKWCTYKLKL